MNKSAILADILFILGIILTTTGIYTIAGWPQAMVAGGVILILTALRYS